MTSLNSQKRQCFQGTAFFVTYIDKIKINIIYMSAYLRGEIDEAEYKSKFKTDFYQGL